MSQVRRGLGELGGISITEERKADGSITFLARAKGRRLDGRDVTLKARGPSRRAASRALRERWEHRRGERAGQTPPTTAEVANTTTPPRLSRTSPIADVAAAWLVDEEANPRTRAQSKATYERTCRVYVIPALGQIGLHEITAGTITSWLRELRAGPTPSSVESVMKVLRRLSKFAAQQGLTDRDFLFGVDIPRAVPRENPRRETITAAELATVFALCDEASPTLGLIARTIAETAARPGEILALHTGSLHPDDTPPWVDIHGTVVAVRGGAVRQAEGKTAAAGRFVTVTPETMDRLVLAAAEASVTWPEPEPASGLRPLFPSRTGGWRSVATVNAMMRKALAGSPVEGVTPRTLRKTLATITAEAYDDQTAADLLGHARVAVTGRHYIRPGVTVRDGASTLDRFLRGDTGV